jgi:glycosyltransferase involved in cell wall biosynthesis
MKPRVLIIRSNSVAPDPRVEKIARSLTRASYPLTVLGWDRTGQLEREDTSQGFRILRLPIRAGYGKGLENFPQLLRWQWGLSAWLASHHREYDILHACDFDTVLPALAAKRLWGKKLVYDIFDFYADHLRRTPELLKWAIRRVDLGAINRADAVILVDDARRDQITGSHPEFSEVIYNSPDDTRLSFLQKKDPQDKSSFRLAYVGLLQVERGLLEVLSVLQRHPDWHLDLAGFGGDEKRILSLARKMPNVTWHGRVSYQQALELSQSADVLFATYDPAIPNHRYSSPNKLFESMMLGLPLVVARHTHMDCLVEKAECGIIIDYGNTTALEEAFRSLAENPLLRQQLGTNARRAYEECYSWQIMETRLLSLYQQLEGIQKGG